MALHSVQTKENNVLCWKQPDVRMLTDWKPKRWLRPNQTVCSGFASGTPTCLVELWAWVRVKGVAQCRMLRRSPRGDTVDAGIGFRLKSQGNKKYSHNLEGTEFLPQSPSWATEPKQMLVFGWFQRHGSIDWVRACETLLFPSFSFEELTGLSCRISCFCYFHLPNSASF